MTKAIYVKWKQIIKILTFPFETGAIVLLYIFSKCVPLRVSTYILGSLASWIGPRLKAHKVGRENIKRALPHIEDKETLLKSTWYNLGCIAAEFGRLRHIEKHRLVCENPDDLRALLSLGKPLIFFTAHMANWELPHLCLRAHGACLHLISRPPNNPLTRKFFDYVRYREGIKFIFKGTQGTRDMIRVLKNAGHIGALLDQRISDGVPLPFFGHMAKTPLGLAKLACAYGALLIPVHIVRLPKSYFRIHIGAPLDRDLSPEDLMREVNMTMEQWIRESPSSWLWFHRRWK